MADGVRRRLAHGVVAGVGAVLLAGCAAGSTGPPVPKASSVGVYDFTTSIPFRTGAIVLEGTFEITQDTVLLVVNNAHCRPVMPGSIASFTYQCEGASFTDVSWIHVNFERRDPLLYCGASAERRIPVDREVCSQYMVTKEGQRVCISWRIETTYQTERQSAGFLVTKRDPWRAAPASPMGAKAPGTWTHPTSG